MVNFGRSKSTLNRVPFSQSPYQQSAAPPLPMNVRRRSVRVVQEAPEPEEEWTSPQNNSTSQTTLTSYPAASSTSPPTSGGPTSSRKGSELFLHITPKPNESPADALTRHYELSQRDIEAIAHHLALSPDQRGRLPQRCNPVDLQHHIQTELLRRVHLGIDIGIPHHSPTYHSRIHLSDSPFAFEIRETKEGRGGGGGEKEGGGGHGKYAFKKPTVVSELVEDPEGEKKTATWMELFFDLTFVANITIFTHQHPIIDTTTFLRYCGWFTILWWMWLSQTMFDVRFSTDDLLNRIWKLIQLFALAGFAGNGDHFTSTNSNGFALSYAVMKLVLVGQYFIVWIHAPDKKSRRPILYYMSANFVSFIMWWASAFLIEFLSDQARYGIWFSAIGIEVLTNIALANNPTVSFAGSHLPERLGLFTLIILGESIMGLFMLTDELVDAPGKLGWDNLTLLIFSITIVKCQWFLYFDDYHEQGPVRSTLHSAIWTYLHFMLNLSQLLLGVGCLDLIRIYQSTRESGSPPSHFEPSHFESSRFPAEAAGAGGLLVARSVPEVGGGEGGAGMGEVGAGAAGEAGGHDAAQLYVKKYYLIVAASVFFFNGTIKYVTSRSQDKYDRAIYLSRFLMAFLILCLLIVERQFLGPFSLLGLEVGFCLLQVGHDLLVLYYAARKEFEDQSS
ncbi:bacterial low temperature requirement A protein-domain-containing protein [Linnemannia elongata]|nr:bacterial low temperature requirement A protein-domain-containing protein [Linnemannia elongata]